MGTDGMGKRTIAFLSGTRADFGKIKPLLECVDESDRFQYEIFATGMHLNPRYGLTVMEMYKSGFDRIHTHQNHDHDDTMDEIAAQTILGFSEFVKECAPDLIVVHGDRPEALAGATVGAMNDVLVAHVEGGEVSGTVDELIRHSVSKLSHAHLVANETARERLLQMGEKEDTIFVIGSPDIDVLLSEDLPPLEEVKEHYEIPFDTYAILLFHPVTTSVEQLPERTDELLAAIRASDENYVVIYPNNDHGSEIILDRYEDQLEEDPRFRIYPSLRFEYFLTLLKGAEFIIGNSSAGIREAPYYGIPTINLGTRQDSRSPNEDILDVDFDRDEILRAIDRAPDHEPEPDVPDEFGDGSSRTRFREVLEGTRLWEIDTQKHFQDRQVH